MESQKNSADVAVPAKLTPESAATLRKRYGGISTTSVSEAKFGIRIGIYGPGGIGKTTLAASIVDSEYGSPALYIDARGNPEVVRSKGDRIQVITAPDFDTVEAVRKDLVRDLQEGTCPFKTVIIDNLSELHAMDLRDRYGADKDITWTMHSATTADILQLARNWSDLATIHAVNVIFIMWDTPEDRTIRGRDVNRSELQFNKALQSQLPGIISWLGRLYITDETQFTRCLDFRPIETMHQAKFQVDPDDPYASKIPMQIYNPSLASIVDTVVGKLDWPAEKHKEPDKTFDFT